MKETRTYLSVGLIANVDEVLDMGNGVDFFKFAGNEESRNSDELELSSEDTFLLEIPIDKVDGDEEGFWEEFEF